MEELSVNERIMETATRLFYCQGYNLTGVNQIIAEANIAKASLYAHYPSKADLLDAYLRQQSDSFFEGLEKRLHELTSPKDKLLAIFTYHKELYECGITRGCPFLKIQSEVAATESGVLKIVESNKARLRAMIVSLVNELPSLDSTEGEILSNAIYFLLEGATITASVNQTTAEIERAVQVVEKLISK